MPPPWIRALAALGRDDRRVVHSRNRTVVPCLPAMSITAKPAAVRPCAPQFFCSAISKRTSRGAKLRRPAPDQQLVAALERLTVLVHGLCEAVEPPGFGRQVGLDAFAGLDAVPAARRHRAVLVDAKRRHHGMRRLVAPGEADAVGRPSRRRAASGRTSRRSRRRPADGGPSETVERRGGFLAFHPSIGLAS